MKVMLLAAGLGTRLQPLTDNIPKCLVPIGRHPLLWYWLRLLESNGILPGHVLINLHHHPDKVKQFLASDPYGAATNTIYEPVLLGTAGTLGANRAFFDDAHTMLVHADNLSQFSLKAFMKAHDLSEGSCAMTMMLFETDQPKSCGIVELDDHGIVTAFHEKVSNPPGNLANGAVYLLRPEVLDFILTLNKPIVDFSSDVIPNFLGRISTFKNLIYHRDIGTIESYEKAQLDFNWRRAD